MKETRPRNLSYEVINNAAHETVDRMQTDMGQVELAGVAKACGYRRIYSVAERGTLMDAPRQTRGEVCRSLIEVKAKIGSMADLGCPTTTP